MAIFKAVTRKDGTAIGKKSPQRLEEYLKFQTDERGRVLYDERGKPLRRDAIISALNADEDDFALSCREIFAQFGVNQRRGSLQYKHYVQGFPPEDNDRMDRETCHRLGVELAQTVWKGFPVLVVSHFDQENDGIYHWHNHFIVGNCNTQTGKKLCTSRDAMLSQKRFVAAQAEANGLARRGLILQDGRILDSKQGERITTGEYQLSKRLQKQAQGLTPEQVREYNTLTEKAELRFAIRIAASQTSTYEEFCKYLKTVYDIEVKGTRGSISYLHPDRAKRKGNYGRGWIRGRSLGKSYEKEAIIDAIEKSDLRSIHRGGDERTTGGTVGANTAGRNGKQFGAAVFGGNEESIDRFTDFYRELYPDLFAGSEADEQKNGRAVGADQRSDRPNEGLGSDENARGSDGIRSDGSKQVR